MRSPLGIRFTEGKRHLSDVLVVPWSEHSYRRSPHAPTRVWSGAGLVHRHQREHVDDIVTRSGRRRGRHVRGSLVGPAGVQAGRIDSVTLDVHGSGDNSTWHFQAAPGMNHISEMARRGHASVFVHSIGYWPSDPVDGNAVCLGGSAYHRRQVIEQLPAGSYAMHGVQLYLQDFCGWGRDVASGEMVNIALAPTVDAPVLLANGDPHPNAPPAAVRAAARTLRAPRRRGQQPEDARHRAPDPSRTDGTGVPKGLELVAHGARLLNESAIALHDAQ